MTYGFLGGKEYDEAAVREYLDGLPPVSNIVVGDGLGLERFIQEEAAKRGHLVRVPETTGRFKSQYMVWAPGKQIQFYGNQFFSFGRIRSQTKNFYPDFVTDQVITKTLLAQGVLVIVGKGSHSTRGRNFVKRANFPFQAVVEL